MAHTTNFLVKGSDYFVAYLDNGNIRVGMTGDRSVDIPVTHSLYESAINAENEDDAEGVFDSLVEAGCVYMGL